MVSEVLGYAFTGKKFLWINEGKVRSVAHSSSCLSPLPDEIQATFI